MASPSSDPNVPNWVKDVLGQQSAGSTLGVYKRAVSFALAGGAGGVPDSAASGTQYSLSNCNPANAGCGAPNIDLDSFVATQGGKVVVEKNVVAGATPVQLKGKMVAQDTWIARDEATAPWASGPLQHSYVSNFSDVNLQFLVTSIDPNNGPQVSTITGSTTRGFGFGGTATTIDDMATLKSSNVSASYQGYFRGLATPQGAITDLNNTAPANSADVRGKAAMTANFGAGTVTGNAYDLQRTDTTNTTTAAPYGVRMDGTITGSTYSGTARYTAATPLAGASASSASPSGQMLGGFFGPKAAETTGVVRIDGTAPGTGAGTGANTTMIGAFGAKKNP